ncbi:MAG: hypothetical protein Ct9H90mP16_07230 [Candidatus Poseidoniales archaeon]|nr:MAG: hypothetical protein Ct9H90mP16_07230 [Candidatus Poseidoniales archaeon]
MFGEWFSTVALFFLIYELTGSELGIGLLLYPNVLPCIPTDLHGMLADRFSRKALMIWANVLSARARLVASDRRSGRRSLVDLCHCIFAHGFPRVSFRENGPQFPTSPKKMSCLLPMH